MKAEEELLSNAAIAVLVIVTVTVEIILTWTLIGLNVLPSIERGYFFVTWIFIAVYAVLSFLWIGGMYRFIMKKTRRRLIKELRR